MLRPLGIEVVPMDAFGPAAEIPEDGTTFEENAARKALAVWNRVGLPTLADDSGLEVDALGGAPGVRSARYAGEGADDEANNRRLLQALRGASDRRARFVCSLAVVRDGKVVRAFRGVCEGRIAHAPSGDGGFGYDPLFIPDGFDRSFAELGPPVKDRISHRARALQALAAWLSDPEAARRLFG